MTSSWIRVESTSMTTRRRPRRARPAGATAMSTPVDVRLQGQLAPQAGRRRHRRRRTRPWSPGSARAVGCGRCWRRGRRSAAVTAATRTRPSRGAQDDDGGPPRAPRRVVTRGRPELDLQPEARPATCPPIDAAALVRAGAGRAAWPASGGRARRPARGRAPRRRRRRWRRRARWSPRAGRPR